MNRDKIGTQTCYVHQHTFSTLMYIACLRPNLVSVHFSKKSATAPKKKSSTPAGEAAGESVTSVL